MCNVIIKQQQDIQEETTSKHWEYKFKANRNRHTADEVSRSTWDLETKQSMYAAPARNLIMQGY